MVLMKNGIMKMTNTKTVQIQRQEKTFKQKVLIACNIVTIDFQISILSVSLAALREKLKKADPNYFSILGLGIWVGFFRKCIFQKFIF